MLKRILCFTLFVCVFMGANAHAQTDIFLSYEFWETATLADVQEEIKNGADVNARDEDGHTALIFASMRNPDPEIIMALIKNGADVNAISDGGRTALYYAKFNGKIFETDAYWKMKELMDKFFDYKFWGTATLADVQKEIKNGADVNAPTDLGETALMFASSFNANPEIIMALIKNGADVHTSDKMGNTALMRASSNSNPEIIKILIKHGADVNTSDENGFTALMRANIMNEKNANPEIIEVLIKNGADVNARTIYAWTPLMYASEKASLEVVVVLIKNGADVNARNKEGRTPLMLASANNTNPEIIEVLIKNGAKE